MEANYSIIQTISKNNLFFYLFDFPHINQVSLVGFKMNEDDFSKKIDYCVGAWRIKKIKN